MLRHSLKYPRKSHRKTVCLPLLSADLAEFVGIMLGDGGINNPWQANITVNATADAAYSQHVMDLATRLFGVAPAIRKRKGRDALVVSLASTTVVNFLIALGLPRGNKLKAGLKIPSWILKKRVFRVACVRGLVDTDGCLYVHVHRVGGRVYKNIGLCFTSHSPVLIRQVADLFEQFGIMPHISGTGEDVYLYRADAVAKYLEIFGTSNERIKSVYTKWRGG